MESKEQVLEINAKLKDSENLKAEEKYLDEKRDAAPSSALIDSKDVVTSLTGATTLDLSNLKAKVEVKKAVEDPDAAKFQPPEDPSITVLMHAARNNRLPLIKWLVDHGDADIEESDSMGATAVFHAANGDAIQAVKWLLENQADINGVDDNGANLLMYAAEGGALNVLKWLMETQNMTTLDTDYIGATPFMYAAQAGQTNVCEHLLKTDRHTHVEDRTEDGHTALVLAALAGKIIMVQWLVSDALAKVETRDEDGCSPFFLATQAGQLEVARWLAFDGMANVEATNKAGFTILMTIACTGDVKLLEFLVDEANAVLEAKTQQGRTALMEAAMCGALASVQWLMDAGAETKTQDIDGRDALMLASQAGHWDVVELLTPVEDEDEESKNRPSWNLVMRTAEKEGLSVVAWLKREQKEGDLLRLGKSGRTFLMHAAFYGKSDVVRSLVEEGNVAILTKRTKTKKSDSHEKGKDAIALAMDKKWIRVALYLVLQLICHEKYTAEELVDARSNELWTGHQTDTVEWLIASCDNEIERSVEPLMLCIKLVWFFEILASKDRIFRAQYTETADRYNKMAQEMFDDVPTVKLASWVLEDRDRNGQCPLAVALKAGNISFVGQPRIDLIVESWWTREDSQRVNFWDPTSFFSSPSIKLMIDRSAFLFFLFLYSCVLNLHVPVDADFHWVEILFYIVGVGYILPERQQLTGAGFKDYISEGWNQIDLLMCSSVFISLMMRTWALPNSTHGSEETWIETVYVGVIAVVGMLIWLRSFEMLATHEKLGPLLISLQNMATDVIQISIIMVVIMGGFWSAFSAIIGDESVKSEPTPGFGTRGDTVLTLYKAAIMGDVEFDNFEGLDGARPYMAITLGALMIVLASTVLLNLLVAMMGNTYDGVKDNSEMQYRFSLINTRWKYDQMPLDLPPPLNLLVIVVSNFYLGAVWIRSLCKKKKRRRRGEEEEQEEHRCAYCYSIFDEKPFNVNKPLSGRVHRFKPKTLKEMTEEVSGKRLCAYCLRCKRLVAPDVYVNELIALFFLKILFWIPLVCILTIISPIRKFFGKLIKFGFEWCCKAKKQQGSIQGTIPETLKESFSFFNPVYRREQRELRESERKAKEQKIRYASDPMNQPLAPINETSHRRHRRSGDSSGRSSGPGSSRTSRLPSGRQSRLRTPGRSGYNSPGFSSPNTPPSPGTPTHHRGGKHGSFDLRYRRRSSRGHALERMNSGRGHPALMRKPSHGHEDRNAEDRNAELGGIRRRRKSRGVNNHSGSSTPHFGSFDGHKPLMSN